MERAHVHAYKYSLKLIHTHIINIYCACRPIFKGKVRADNDLKPFTFCQ